MKSTQSPGNVGIVVRATLVVLAVSGFGFPSASQDAANLRQKLDAKLAQTWVKNADWITDFGAAKAAAKKRGTQIFGYFTRSYAP